MLTIETDEHNWILVSTKESSKSKTGETRKILGYFSDFESLYLKACDNALKVFGLEEYKEELEKLKNLLNQKGIK